MGSALLRETAAAVTSRSRQSRDTPFVPQGSRQLTHCSTKQLTQDRYVNISLNEKSPEAEHLAHYEEQMTLWNWFLSAYRTTETATIRSSLLRGPQICCYAVIIPYVVIYQMYCKLAFLQGAPVVANVLTQVEQPSSNFFTCTDLDLNCNDAWRPLRKIGYCSPSALPQGFAPCRYYDVHEVQPVKYASAEFIATSFVEMSQTRCATAETGGLIQGHGCKNLWQNRNISRHFVAAVEDFQVIVKHSVGLRDRNSAVWSGYEMIGRVLDADGTESRIPYGGFNTIHLPDLDESLPSCGATVAGVGACFTNDRGDVLSLGRILQMAEIDLDVEKSGNKTRRIAGVAIKLNIHYENKRYFWHWPFGSIITKTYSAHEMDFGEHARFRISEWHDLSTVPNQRELYAGFGALIVVATHGVIGTTNILACVFALVASMTVFKFGTFFIEKVLVQLYKYNSDLNYIYFVFRFFSVSYSPRPKTIGVLFGDRFTKGVHDFSNKDLADFNRLSWLCKQSFWEGQLGQMRAQMEQIEASSYLSALVAFGGFVLTMFFRSNGD